MKTIALINQKGGVAKTTTAINLAVGLARKGKQVVIIDLDSQSNTTTYLSDIQDHKFTIADCFEDATKANISMTYTTVSKLVLIPCDLSFCDYDAKIKMEASHKSMHDRLLKVLNEIERKNAFDYCIIDCSPQVDVISLNACIASDLVIIPIEPIPSAITGFINTLEQVNLARESYGRKTQCKVLFTKVNRTNNDRNTIKDTENAIQNIKGIEIYDSQIRYQSVPVTSAALSKEFVIDGTSNVARDYQDLVREVLSEE